jgi:hypothetical protein
MVAIKKSITIRSDQQEYIEREGICLSRVAQKALDANREKYSTAEPTVNIVSPIIMKCSACGTQFMYNPAGGALNQVQRPKCKTFSGQSSWSPKDRV